MQCSLNLDKLFISTYKTIVSARAFERNETWPTDELNQAFLRFSEVLWSYGIFHLEQILQNKECMPNPSLD